MGGAGDDDGDEAMGEKQERALTPAPAALSDQDWLKGGLGSMAKLLRRFGLRDQPDTVKEFAETFAEISSSLTVSGKQCYQAPLDVLGCWNCWYVTR